LDPKHIGGNDLDFSGSRDVVGHVARAKRAVG